MRNRVGIRPLFSVTLLLSLGSLGAEAQIVDLAEQLLDRRVPKFEMRNGTLFDGVARLSAEPTQLAFAFEDLLTAHPHDPLPPEVPLSIHLDNGTIRELLTTMCRADGRYTWTRDGTTVNVYPKETVGGGSYLMNRRLPRLELTGVSAAEDAMFAAVTQLPPPFEQIAFAQAGGDTSFPTPWKTTFENLTLRHALNLIARNISFRGGWVLSGSRDFRTVGFHNQRIHESQTNSE
jgi:hypothetical protein